MSIIPELPTRPGTPNIFVQDNVAAGATQTVPAGTTSYWTGSSVGYLVAGVLNNSGTLWDSGSQGSTTASVTSGGQVSNAGSVIADTDTGNAAAIEAVSGATGGTINTTGHVWALASAGNAYGLWVSQTNEVVFNSGTIAAQASSDPTNPSDPWGAMTSGAAYGIYADGGNVQITNSSAGQILVEGDQAIGIWTRGSASNASYSDEVINQGTIESASTDSSTPSYGLLLADTTGQLMRVVNTGTIQADVAISAPSEGNLAGASTIQYGAESITNGSTGIIEGGIDLYNGNDALVNQGVIKGGWVDMGPGNDTLDTSAGTLTGLVYMGLGDDTFIGSAGNDVVTGEGGNDNLQGNAGDDLLMGGTGNDTLVGGPGNDGLYGEFGNDRIEQQGGDNIYGGDGNDRIELSDYTFSMVDGGTGFDTLVLPTGSRLVDLSAIAASGRVTSIEEIDLNGSKEVVIRAGDVAAIGGGSQLVIGATSNDKVDLAGSWASTGTDTLNGVTYAAYSSNGATVLVQQGAIISVGGSVPFGAVGLDAIASGSLPPQPGASTGLYANQGLTALWDPYEIDGAQTRVESYETWQDMAGRAVFTSSETANESTTLTNLGQIESFGTNEVTQAITLARGVISNSGTIAAQNSGAGASVAIEISVSGSITNDNQIGATAVTGDATAINTSDVRLGASVLNDQSGQINASTTNGTAIGIQTLSDGAQIVNHGAVNVAGGARGIGVAFGSAGGTLTNDGSINISSSTAGGAIGFSAAGESELINTGSISGDIAVLYEMRFGLGFTLNNSGLLAGAVDIGLYDPSSTYGHVQLNNSGQIQGSIMVDAAATGTINIVNSGKIDGTIGLGGGADTYDGSGGLVTGTVFGGAGNDRLIGGTSDDTLTGGPGSDTLTGGAGHDTFCDTKAGLNGDTITDFGAGDKIIITDATLGGFNFSLSGHTLAYTGGSLILSAVPSGHLVASSATGGGVQLTLAKAPNDFNGDGISDLMWRNDNGTLSEWLGHAGGGFSWNGSAAYTVGTDWAIKGFGDFNGDGYADILWQQSGTGAVMQWFGHSDGTFAWNANYALGSNFSFAGIGDFNGDGRADVMWRDASGTLSEWLAQANGSFAWNGNAAYQLSTAWTAAGTGDFNGDGKSDILWRDGSGNLSEWLGQSDGTFAYNGNAAYQLSTDWQVAAMADLNGDGKTDILWRNSSGAMSEWLGQSDGTFVYNANAAYQLSTDWHVASSADFNGDGIADLVWQNSSGTLMQWLGHSDGTFAWSSNPTTLDPSWHVQPTHALM